MVRRDRRASGTPRPADSLEASTRDPRETDLNGTNPESPGGSPALRPLLRSVLGVLAGLVTAVALVVALTALAVFVVFGGDFAARPTPPYLVVNLSYTFGAAVVGGWLAGRIAGRRPLLHGAVLAALMLLLSGTGGGAPPTPGVPEWYVPAVSFLGPAGALCGGLLGRLRLAR